MSNSEIVNSEKECNILFLHHSTGHIIYHAGEDRNVLLRKLFPRKAFVEKWFDDYNKINNTHFIITNQFFPKNKPYGWNNYPYDYYNIWVKHAGIQPYLEEPTLEILTKKYNVIIFKHCYPVSNIEEDHIPDINSSTKTLENYKLQYEAIKQKLYEFPQTKFLIWTGAIQVEKNISQDQAERAKEFFLWVKNEWDKPDDNIFIWDFYNLETDGTLYLINNYSQSNNNSHPGKLFAKKVAPLFCKKIIEVIHHNNFKSKF